MLAETARFLSREARPLIGTKGVVTVPNPPVASDWVRAVPSGEQWRIQCGVYTLSNDANVANRIMHFFVMVDGQIVFQAVDQTSETANANTVYSIIAGSGAFFNAKEQGMQFVPMPSMWLPQGAVIGTSTTALQAGDQYSAINLYVERCYITDQQLEVVAEEEQRSYLQAMGGS